MVIAGVTHVAITWAVTSVQEEVIDARVRARYGSFDEYYRSDYSTLLGFGFVLTGSRQNAEDLVQDALTEAHRRWKKIDGYDDPGAWVRRVMVNKSRSKFRKLTNEAKAFTRLGGRRIEDVAMPTERGSEVLEAVRALPERQRQTIALRYWEDRSVNEIAAILGCGSETVKTHLKRGRAALGVQLVSYTTEDDSGTTVQSHE